MVTSRRPSIEIDLNAAIVAVETRQPLILVVHSSDPRQPDGLPFGPFDPLAHRTFEAGLRSWVAEQTALKIGYVEQLYTFGDHGRHVVPGDAGAHMVSVGYLALTRPSEGSSRALARAGALWRRWYEYFPWEDWREGRPDILDNQLLPALRRWARGRPAASDAVRPLGRRERLKLAFGEEGGPWDEERVLERYGASLWGRPGHRSDARRPIQFAGTANPTAIWRAHALRSSPDFGDGNLALAGKAQIPARYIRAHAS